MRRCIFKRKHCNFLILNNCENCGEKFIKYKGFYDKQIGLFCSSKCLSVAEERILVENNAEENISQVKTTLEEIEYEFENFYDPMMDF